MASVLAQLRHQPLFWLLPFGPAVLIAESRAPEALTALFLLSVLAVVPLAGLLSHATESVAGAADHRLRLRDAVLTEHASGVVRRRRARHPR